VAAKPKPAAAKPAPAKPIAVKPAPAPPVLAAPVETPLTGADRDKLDLQRVSTYLNSVRTLKGQFVQSGPNGELDQGVVYVNKPGRMRFEYAKPSPYLIVADGVSIAVGNSDVKTVDRYPLIDNPLSLILDDKIDLGATSSISRIERKPGQLVITARREDGSLKGQVTLIFAEPSLELKQWVVTDAQGLQTMITLQDVQTGVTLEPELFILRDVNKFADPRE
jgi:outer membrane lipoprotein-sorting protein